MSALLGSSRSARERGTIPEIQHLGPMGHDVDTYHLCTGTVAKVHWSPLDWHHPMEFTDQYHIISDTLVNVEWPARALDKSGSLGEPAGAATPASQILPTHEELPELNAEESQKVTQHLNACIQHANPAMSNEVGSDGLHARALSHRAPCRCT